MKKIFILRLLVYPVICSIIWSYCHANYSQFILVKMADQIMMKAINLPIDNKTKVIIFGYAFGYIYGTISVFLKARKFRGILFLAVFLFKVIQSMFFAFVGIYFYLLEILLLPFIMIYLKKKKKTKKEKAETKKQEEYKLIKEELIVEIKKQLLQENKI